MEKIKEYKGIIILILVVLGGAFYWYEWRPTQIRKDCFNTSQDFSDKQEFYKNCVMGNGLEK
ncbi:MAG: hypothetical protein UY07_C0027G0009 [Parcubacteria group bacterium GW2011_GWA1_47_8]|nr:MAG: hypothetical protein UY07_C0027G0009 [Parcubacteria group bacterium GW2011_GWA1_47_8]KKW07038.1 MAG: hypothetical protein UY42_C0019G0004 [Parcubacteria group bacterium GW2011_GWA2_49_16]